MANFETPKILVVAGHIGDFVWRSGGSIAKYAKAGSSIKLVIISDGLRGEANDYWKTEGANEAEGHIRRKAEGSQAAQTLGVETVDHRRSRGKTGPHHSGVPARPHFDPFRIRRL